MLHTVASYDTMMLSTGEIMRAPYDRFIEKVNKTDSCWEWTASKYRGGYGHFRLRVDGIWKMVKAHRFSYEQTYGKIPNNLLVCHKCDNPGCVNPDHLFLGTTKDNVTDRINKGRCSHHRKERKIVNGINLLTKQTAEDIRKDYANGMSYNELVKKYATSKSQVCRIVLNQIWK